MNREDEIEIIRNFILVFIAGDLCFLFLLWIFINFGVLIC